jgi:hypothetical protein
MKITIIFDSYEEFIGFTAEEKALPKSPEPDDPKEGLSERYGELVRVTKKTEEQSKLYAELKSRVEELNDGGKKEAIEETFKNLGADRLGNLDPARYADALEKLKGVA